MIFFQESHVFLSNLVYASLLTLFQLQILVWSSLKSHDLTNQFRQQRKCAYSLLALKVRTGEHHRNDGAD